MSKRLIAAFLAAASATGCGPRRESHYIPPLPTEYNKPLALRPVGENQKPAEMDALPNNGDSYLFDGFIDLNGRSREKKNGGLHVRFYKSGKGYALEIEDPYGGKRTYFDLDGDLDPQRLESELGLDRKEVDIKGLQSEKDVWNWWLDRIKAERGL